ncbi:MAG TPA: ABC transporter permease [Chloroflexia bacterium]|jgi:peptide/nickel transport system permease protein
MTTYIVRRFIQAVMFIFLAWLLLYTGLVLVMPKGPGQRYSQEMKFYTLLEQQAKARGTELGSGIDADTLALKERYGLDKPWPLNFLFWLFDPADASTYSDRTGAVSEGIDLNLGILHVQGSGMLTGDFGESEVVVKGRKVSELLGSRLNNTVVLVGASLFVAILVALPMGIIAATRHRSLSDHALTFTAFAGFAIPPFSLATLFIVLLSVLPYQLRTTQHWDWLPYLPAGGISAVGESDNWVNRLYYLVLPVAAVSLPQIAWLSRHIRSAMLEVLKLDYIRTAWAKGLPNRLIILRHALRNALVPFITAVGLAVPLLVVGATMIETVFGYSGMGQLYFKSLGGCLATPETFLTTCAESSNLGSLQAMDYPVAIAVTFILIAVVAIANMLADIGYALADPRISYRGR